MVAGFARAAVVTPSLIATHTELLYVPSGTRYEKRVFIDSDWHATRLAVDEALHFYWIADVAATHIAPLARRPRAPPCCTLLQPHA